MKIYLDQEKQRAISRSYLLVDSNVISFMFSSPERFDCFQNLFKSQYFLIDPLASFEFVRDAFLPDIYTKKKEFINNDDFFLPANSHPDLLNKIRENALLLSRIYAHHLNRDGVKRFPPLVDLYLAGRLMLQTNVYFVTSDFEDFPLFLFNRINLITFEDNKDERTVVQILEFNKEKFSTCLGELENISKKVKQI